MSILQKMDVQRLPECPLLHVSALCDLPEAKKIRKKIKKFGIVPGIVEKVEQSQLVMKQFLLAMTINIAGLSAHSYIYG